MLNGKLIYLAYVALAGLLGVGGFVVVPKLLNKNPPAAVTEQAPIPRRPPPRQWPCP